jgi:hypothetical protein
MRYAAQEEEDVRGTVDLTLEQLTYTGLDGIHKGEHH